MAALFADLQKGEGITAGLRKVTDDMKAKNRQDRTGVVAATAAPAAGPRTAAGAQAPAGPARFELEQGRKWVVENQRGNRELVISDTTPKQAVYIYGCRDSVVQVKGKVNTISIDNCHKSGVVFDDVISCVEVVNCTDMQVQCTVSMPTLNAEKCDGVQIFVTPALAADDKLQVVTAKSSALNVVVADPEAAEDPREYPVPEQFISMFKNGRLVTEAVVHSAA